MSQSALTPHHFRFPCASSAGALLLAAAFAPAAATTYTQPVTVTKSAYVDLGAGPLDIGVNSYNGVSLIVSDAQPAATAIGVIVSPNTSVTLPKITFCQTSHIWAIALQSPASATLNVTPTTCGSSGGAVTAISGAYVSGAIADLALAQNSTTAGEVGNLPLTATTTGAPTYTTAKSNPLSTDTGGNLRTVLNAETSKVIGEVNQGTSPWVISGAVTGTFWQTTQPTSIASAQVASGAFASGAFASGAISDGAEVTLGAKADAASTATDTTPVTVMQVLKEISAKEQTPASRAVTGTFYQATQPASLASAQVASGAYAAGSLATGAGVDGWNVTEGAKADAAWTSGSGSIVAILKAVDRDITSAIPTQAPTVSIGGVGIVDSAGTNVATVKAASTLPVAGDKQLVVGLNPDNAANTTPYIVNMASQYPAGAVQLNPVSGIGTTGAASVTLTPVSGHTAFLCGYSIRANATAAATVTDTITGLTTSVTQTHLLWVAPAASGLGIDEQVYPICRSASAVTTNIVITSGAPGAGGNVTVDAWGYSL
jgi:hypothetical protein